MNLPIGVLDSGIGGLTVLKVLSLSLPNEDFIYYADSKNAPYGTKSVDEIYILVDKIIKFLINKKCKLIVIACNTATAAVVSDMRKKYKIPIVGLEPAVKPACLNTKTNNIGVLATEGTFRGQLFIETSEKYKNYVNIHLQVAKGLVELAENGVFDGEEVENILKKYIKPFIEHNVDHIVLGCTHYPFFTPIIKKITNNKIKIIDSAEAVARRTKDLLMTNSNYRKEANRQNIKIYTSANKGTITNVANKLFNVEYNSDLVEYFFI
ncbi:MAG: glutamate racemase [Bacteroidales bacterium]|jgi:glutamate racemase|nr:glutamate racemase [Bacteroidales bacterium]MCK9497884.1 glutamate racemase [Bacteroidales bacterium]MDY0314533.1 glutamate racemase [Bacteroidales bacterium]NLB86861.1 glutamate racemase [Bacteroidales bacterium]